MSAAKHLLKKHLPVIIGIAGGSGAGKTWLARQLMAHFEKEACIISLDDFYLDRSHLPPARRAKINFDHPRCIDWGLLEQTLQKCLSRRPMALPSYDFATHSRRQTPKQFVPKPLILLEGLWLLRRPAIRRLCDYTIFLSCPSGLRLKRRIKRDCLERGRSKQSIKSQFQKCVAPMHDRFVEPQQRWADRVFKDSPGANEMEELVSTIKTLI